MWNEAKNKVTQSYHKSNEAFYDKMVNVSYTQNVNEKKNILNSSRKNATQNDIKSTINTRKPRNYAETEDKYIFDFPPQKKKKYGKKSKNWNDNDLNGNGSKNGEHRESNIAYRNRI